MNATADAWTREGKTALSSLPFLMATLALMLVLLPGLPPYAHAEKEMRLEALIAEALQNNPDIRAVRSRESAARYRVQQAGSLPDPMFMTGYMNMGTRDLYTFGEEMAEDSQWMFSLSQLFPFPGKLPLKERAAAKDASGVASQAETVRLQTAARVKELYYDLVLAYRNIDLIRERSALFSRIEDAALARYSSGMAPQQEAVMAQTEKYVLMEKEEMERQKIQSREAAMNAVLGREADASAGRPAEPPPTDFVYELDELLRLASEASPLIRARKEVLDAGKAKAELAERDYYPDFTVSAGYFLRGADFEDMWNLTTSVNIPLFYRTKQRQAVRETREMVMERSGELRAAELMTGSGIRENYSLVKTAEKLMALYRDGLVPKAYQDYELALAGYAAGQVEAITAISRLKALLDFEFLYWEQFAAREKAIARIEALAGITDLPHEQGRNIHSVPWSVADNEKE